MKKRSVTLLILLMVSHSLLAQNTKKERVSFISVSSNTIIVPATTYMPQSTLARLSELSKLGIKVVFMEHLLKQPTGFYQQQEHTTGFQKLAQNIPNNAVLSSFEALEKLHL